jgi:hypothetical protein
LSGGICQVCACSGVLPKASNAEVAMAKALSCILLPPQCGLFLEFLGNPAFCSRAAETIFCGEYAIQIGRRTT